MRELVEIIDLAFSSLDYSAKKDTLVDLIASMYESDVEDILEQADIRCNKDCNIDELTEKIKQWHHDRRSTMNGNSITQFGKLIEEASELLLAIQRKDYPEIVDAIGDIYVVLVAIATLEGIHMSEAIESAYKEIKDRKGYLDESGNFINQE